MGRRAIPGGCLAMLLLAGVASAQDRAQADADRASSLGAVLTLHDATGARIETPLTGTAVRIDVALSDAATGAAPRGLLLEGWVRPRASTDLPCTEAARAFRATRRIPRGGIDLNGVVLAAFHRDGSFGLADPRLDLATANALGAGRLPHAPRLAVADRIRQRVLIFDDDTGVAAIGTTGGVTRIAASLPVGRVTGLAAARDGVWIAGSGAEGRDVTLLGADDAVIAAHRFTTAVTGLSEAGEDVLAVFAPGQVAFIDRHGGAVLAEGHPDLQIRAAAAATLDDGHGGDVSLIAALGPDPETGWLIFADAPSDPVAVPLAAPATHVAIHPLSGAALFWDKGGAITVVDPASGQAMGAVALAGGLGAVAFAGDAAFLMAPDQSGVSVLDLGSVGPGITPILREVRLGPKTPGRVDEDVSGLLVSLDPSPQVLAVNAETYTGFVVDERSSMGDAPPMTAVRLRGGVPARVVVLDRSFNEVETGRFRTWTTLSEPGPHELVLTTGIGGMSVCFSFDAGPGPGFTTAAAQAPRPLDLQLEGTARAGEPSLIRVALTDADGAAIAPLAPSLIVASLAFGWHRQIVPTTTGTSMEFVLQPPVAGLYTVQVHDPVLRGADPPTRIMEVTR